MVQNRSWLRPHNQPVLEEQLNQSQVSLKWGMRGEQERQTQLTLARETQLKSLKLRPIQIRSFNMQIMTIDTIQVSQPINIIPAKRARLKISKSHRALAHSLDTSSQHKVLAQTSQDLSRRATFKSKITLSTRAAMAHSRTLAIQGATRSTTWVNWIAVGTTDAKRRSKLHPLDIRASSISISTIQITKKSWATGTSTRITSRGSQHRSPWTPLAQLVIILRRRRWARSQSNKKRMTIEEWASKANKCLNRVSICRRILR